MEPEPHDNNFSDLDFDSAAAVAELDVEEAIEPGEDTWSGPRCEKCAAPIKSDVVTVCRQCGWYPSLGQFVEIDQDWETECDDDSQKPVDQPRPSHAEVWMNLLPWWAWVLIGTVGIIVVESVAVRLLTPAAGGLRMTWSVAQLFLGLFALVACHFFTFVVAVADDAEVGALDFILKPIKLWIRAAKELPRRLWVADAALAGLIGVIMSIVVIGALPYERLWDWGFEKPPEQNLMGAVMSRMKKLESEDGADNLEGAVNDFAGSQDQLLEPGASKPAPPKPRETVDCVIIGYRLDAEGKLSSLILASAFKRQLAYAGYVTPQMPEDELAELAEKLTAAKTDQPFLTIHTSGYWVKPKYSCRVSYTKRSDSGRLLDPQWEEMLGTLGPIQ